MRILITGEKGYIGTSLEKWLNQWEKKYFVDFLSLKKSNWREKDFSQYDILVHVAAIVHKKEQPEMEDLYLKVNKELTIEIATKAKTEGIKHFIFMSTLSVYGLTGMLNEEIVITNDTSCSPNTFYGKSKLEAEHQLTLLEDKNFIITIIRAPMIYGPNCPGNYVNLKRIIKLTPFFPILNNKRSMIYIDNLTEFIRLIIDNQESGLMFPQNREYVNTTELAMLIAKENSKNVKFSKGLGLVIKLVGMQNNILNKVFGNLVIDKSLSNYMNFDYCVVSFGESVKLCEKNIKGA